VSDLEAYHTPVLVQAAVSLLVRNPGGIYVDGTVGGGGHSKHILLNLNPSGRLVGFDQDAEAIAFSREVFDSDMRVILIHSNVMHLRPRLEAIGIGAIDGILLDLGVSSHQLDAADRGFSFRNDGPLDMRMDTNGTLTAQDIINTAGSGELERIFREYGEERHSRAIADAIVRRRSERQVGSTRDLVAIIRSRVPEPHVTKTLARVFQALRIAVNDELNILRDTLREAFSMLALNGRMVVISWHSLEDRIVKNFLREESRTCICPPGLPVCVCGKVQRMKVLTSKPVCPGEKEQSENPRARSAKLRAGEKIHE
jgi:16S rRNA (cytosine1402-N4)-methyltransferase